MDTKHIYVHAYKPKKERQTVIVVKLKAAAFVHLYSLRIYTKKKDIAIASST